MKIPPTSYQAGVCRQYSQNIILQNTLDIQESAAKFSSPQICQRLARLSVAIEQKTLHDSLEILEEAGFRNELALFVLGYIQQALGVAR